MRAERDTEIFAEIPSNMFCPRTHVPIVPKCLYGIYDTGKNFEFSGVMLYVDLQDKHCNFKILLSA